MKKFLFERKIYRFRINLILLLAVVWGNNLQAQEQSAAVHKAGVYISPPFVMQQDGRYSGMAIDLWESVAAAQNIQFEYQQYSTLVELVEATEAGSVDFAVTNLTITQDRAQRIDFTHPWYDAGLRIMVSKSRAAGFGDVMAGLRDSGHLRGYAWLTFIVLLATLLFTLFDRKFDQSFPSRWREGLAESFYSVMAIATSGRMVRKNLFGWAGRIWEALWLMCGIAVVAYITASVTSVMTTLSLSNQIHGLRDLPGKTVAVFSGSVAEAFIKDASIAGQSYKDIDEAVKALLAGKVDAIVADSPVLKYYAHTHPEQEVTVVGSLFEPDKYGFGLRLHSKLTRPMSVEIIGAYESGLVEELRKKYFGEKH